MSIARTTNYYASNRQDVKRQKRSRCQIPAVQSAVCVNQALNGNKTAYVEQLVYHREKSTLTDMPIHIKQNNNDDERV